MGRSRRLLTLRGLVPLSSDQRNQFHTQLQEQLVLSSAMSGTECNERQGCSVIPHGNNKRQYSANSTVTKSTVD
jgi:hypothetical protein